MRFYKLDFPVAFLSIITSIMTLNGPVRAESIPEPDVVKQLESMQEMISKFSLQISLLQSYDNNQKSEIQRIQRESELKEGQMRNQLNDLADQYQNLRQLLEKILSPNSRSVELKSNNITEFSPLSDYEREFSQYMAHSGGVTYIRWGRTTCEDPSYPLCTGYSASGEAGAPKGGTPDIVCLHSQPQYGNILPGGFSFLSDIEYYFYSLPFSTANNGGAKLRHNDMPCTVCHISSRSHQFMLPGRNTCPSGWVREYWGYLASSHRDGSKSAMVCLDQAPEAVPGGIENRGAYIYPVESTCTALHCPPYRADYKLTCTVCSK